MTFKAIFKGQHLSMGYVHGREYRLQVLVDSDRPRIVKAMPPGKEVKYSSWTTFWQNWDRVQ